MTIGDLKYLLRDYEKITLCDYDTNEHKDINEYKQNGRRINTIEATYVLDEAIVFYRKK